MGFYGGRTGQHFYIAKSYTSEIEMSNDINSILNNQFVLTVGNNDNTLWIKHDGKMVNIGNVGSFYPEINDKGKWFVGDKELGTARPAQLYLRVQYDNESDNYSSDTLEYAYGEIEGQENNEEYLNTLEWKPLINFTGLTNLRIYRDEALEALNTIQEYQLDVKDKAIEVTFLTELNKSYTNGTGDFGEQLEIPDIEGCMELSLERDENQSEDNAKYYAESAQASKIEASDSLSKIETIKQEILNRLDTDEEIDYLGLAVEIDQAARRDGKLGSSQEAYFLTDRLDNFLYQFDTYAEMRECRQLRPGDTCTTLGVSRLGDSNSILFRVYDPNTFENGETLEDRLKKDLHWDEETQKWFINLPGGSKMASEKQSLENGYVAYSVAMFSGLGGGGGGGGNTSAGSLTVSYTETAISLPSSEDPAIEIPFVWYGTVSGDGKLYVKDSLEGTIINGSTVPEGNQSFKWKPTLKGTHILNIYVRDRMNQNTNVVALTINVGALELSAQTANNATFSFGQTVYFQFRSENLNKSEVTLIGGLYQNNKMIQSINHISNSATLTHNITLSFLGLSEIGAYTIKVHAQAGDLQSNEISLTFLLVSSGKLSILEMYDEDQSHPEGDFIPITYQAYFKDNNANQFEATYYIRGGNIPSNECTVTIGNGTYKQINIEPMGITPNVNNTYNLTGDFLTQSNIDYEFMIKVYDPEVSNQTAYLSTPILIKIIEKATERYPNIEEWGSNYLVYYFDSRLGQQNSDLLTERVIWKNIANKYNIVKNSDGTTSPSNIIGQNNISLIDSSFNWVTNGWNLTLNDSLYEGLRFDGNAYALLYPDKNIFKEGFIDKVNDTKTTGGATLDIYFKPYYTGVNSRLFECAFNSDLTTGIFINETSASMSGSVTSTAEDLSVEFTPNQPVHLTFVYEPMGMVLQEVKKEDGTTEIQEFGLMKIYLNGVCCAAKSITAATLKDLQIQGFYFNKSKASSATKTEIGEQEIYSVRMFNNFLTADEILKLYIKDLTSVENDRKEIYEKNFGVEDDSGTYILPFDLPEVHFYVKAMSMDKMDKDNALPVRVTLEKSDEVIELGSKGEEWENCAVTWQGTSSIAYPVKNYKVKLRTNDNKKIKYQLYHGTDVDAAGKPLYPRGKKESTFTMKADYMDSSHCHNTGNANFVNDTGLLTKYSLTPAQVRDLDRNAEAQGETPLIQNDCYYFDNGDGTYRPYKTSDYKGATKLEIRNSIYGFPCRLYIHLGTSYDEVTGEWTYGGQNYAGIYNFNHDKGCTDTFGLYRDDDGEPIFPHCTSFEIKANSNSTAGAFKKPQFVEIKQYDSNGNEIEITDDSLRRYGITSYNTRYNINNKIIYNIEQQNSITQAYCKVFPCNADGSGIDSENEELVLFSRLRIIDKEPESEAYEKYLKSYYETSFELRFPDTDLYEKADKTMTLDYYDEYEKVRVLVDWVDTADDTEFKNNFKKHFDLDSTLNYFLFVMTTGLIDNFGKNLMLNTWGINSEGKIPYIKDDNGIYSLRWYDLVNERYVDGYSDLVLNDSNKILIKDIDGNPISSIGGIDENGYYDYSLLDLRIYEDDDENLIRTWERKIDINDIVWYPHPYDLDSCLGSDNSGYLRYGVDIEMLPTLENPGFNDFYTKTWNNQATPFNTAVSSLWYKFQRVFSEELIERYGQLRDDKILDLNTFKKYYYDEEIGRMTKKDYNDDGYAKYVSDELANVVVEGEEKKVYPSSYAFINRGDDWGRLYSWMEKRLIFLDSLYDYGQKSSVVEARAMAGDYLIELTTHDPQYVTVVWSNESDSGDTTLEKEVENILNDDTTYYLARTYIGGYEQYGISNKVLYSLNTDTKEYVEDPAGQYYKFYQAINSGKYWVLNDNNEPIIDNYYLPVDWYFNLNAKLNTQKYKIGKKFVLDTNTDITRLEDTSREFTGKSSTDDQEVQIFGAFNLKYIKGLSSLTPTKLIIKAATKLLSLECSSPALGEIDATTATMLRSVDLTNCSKLAALNLPGAIRLKSLNLGLSGVSSLVLPEDGGNLQKLTLGPAMKSIALSKQYQLSKVTLQRTTATTSINDFLYSSNPITAINLIDCPRLSFDFEMVTTDTLGNKITTGIDQTNKTFQGFVADYGLFSIFNRLNTLTLNNSYIYNEESNINGIGANGEFRLSIPAQSTLEVNSDNSVNIDYGPLSSVNINIPVEKIIFNNNISPSKGIVWPGQGIFSDHSKDMMEQRANSFRIGSSVKSIEIKGMGTTYMPCVNYWGNMVGLEKVILSGQIRNKESRLINYSAASGKGDERNSLVIILPDKVEIGNEQLDQVFKELTLNTVTDQPENDSNKIVDITAVFSVKNLDDKIYSVVQPNDTADWVVVKQNNDTKKIVDLSSFSTHGIKMNFSQLKYIKEIKGFENLLIGNEEGYLNNFENLFYNCNSLTDLYNSSGNKLDVKNDKRIIDDYNLFDYPATSMSRMFYRCYNLEPNYITPLFARTANALLTKAEYMVQQCHKLTEINLTWTNATSLESLKGFAYYCNGLTKFAINGAKCDKLTNLSNLVYFPYSSSSTDGDVSQLKEFSLNIIKTSDSIINSGMTSVTNMDFMLHGASSLEKLDMSSWNLNNIETMSNMCNYCSSLIEVIAPNGQLMEPAITDRQGEYTFNKLTDLSSAFANCKALIKFLANSDNPIGYYIWNFKKDTKIDNLLQSNSAMTENTLWALLQWPMTNVISMNALLQSAKGPANLDLKNWDLSKVVNASYLFASYNSNIVFADGSKLSHSGINENKFIALQNAKSMFESSAFTEIDTNIIQPNAPLTDISAIFKDSKVNSDGLGDGYKSWTTSSVTDFSSAFKNTKLSSLDLNTWNFDNSGSFVSMFEGMSSLASFEGEKGISHLITSNNTKTAINIQQIFSGCGLLEETYIKQFKDWMLENKLTTLQGVFAGCKLLTTATTTATETDTVKNLFNDYNYSNGATISIQSIFEGCTGLTDVEMPTLNVGLNGATKAFANCFNAVLDTDTTSTRVLNLQKVDFSNEISDGLLTMFNNCLAKTIYFKQGTIYNSISIATLNAIKINALKVGLLKRTNDINTLAYGLAISPKVSGAYVYLPSSTEGATYSDGTDIETAYDDYLLSRGGINDWIVETVTDTTSGG